MRCRGEVYCENSISFFLACMSAKDIDIVESLACLVPEFVALRVISRNCRPEEDSLSGLDLHEDERGVKKRVNRFGVTVGGFLGFPSLA